MQAVGLALPELYHLRAQDVATPTERNSGFSVVTCLAGHSPVPRLCPGWKLLGAAAEDS